MVSYGLVYFEYSLVQLIHTILGLVIFLASASSALYIPVLDLAVDAAVAAVVAAVEVAAVSAVVAVVAVGAAIVAADLAATVAVDWPATVAAAVAAVVLAPRVPVSLVLPPLAFDHHFLVAFDPVLGTPRSSAVVAVLSHTARFPAVLTPNFPVVVAVVVVAAVVVSRAAVPVVVAVVAAIVAATPTA